MSSSPQASPPLTAGNVLIKSVSVVREDGVCLFQQNFGQNNSSQLNPQLMGGFFSAISHFAQVNSGQQVTSIQLNEDVILVEAEQDFYFILQYSPQFLDAEGAKLILYLTMQEFLARFPDAKQANESQEFDSFYDVVPGMVENVLEQTIQFDCPWCQKQHSVVVLRNQIDASTHFPVKLIYVHGGSQEVLNLFIDQDFKVINVEIASLIEMKKDDVAEILDAYAEDLDNLTPSVVFGVLLSHEGQLRAQYMKEGWIPGCELDSLINLWSAGKKCTRDELGPEKLLFKMPDYWLIGVQANEHELMVLAAPDVNGPQLFPQVQVLLDRLLPLLSASDLKD
ncbi:MAG TPA: hypothetical protein VKK79_11010 [Candidatus Lokiarchaeia archaeon]|nr:hypothetical protein [Candidatus Lokiarchaeia archaeon]